MKILDKMPEIPEKLVDHLIGNLGEGYILFFAGCWHVYGTYSPVFSSGGIPHPVHFREGMEIRNAIRESGMCEDWDSEILDDIWCYVIDKVVKRYTEQKR